MQTQDPIALVDSVSQTITFDASATGVMIANESPLAIKIAMAGFSRWLPAWTVDFIPITGMQAVTGKLVITPKNISSASNSPSSEALITIYESGDTVTGIYPCALTRQANIGNGVIPTTATNSLVNDGNVANTQIIETTPTGQSTSAFVLDNMGNLTLRTLDNNVWSVVISIVQNASGAATKLFHGTADSVPATGLTGTGPIPSAITQWGSNAGGQQFSIAALNGTGQTGIMDKTNDVGLYSHNNVILSNNNVFNGTNDLYVTANPAAQAIIGSAANGLSQPNLAIRYSTNTPSAGAAITWGVYANVPVMVDSGGGASEGLHIFTGTGTPGPSGQTPQNGDLWFNG